MFLIADSAVTDIMDHKNNLVLPEKTTFGEQQGSIDGGKKYVYERALKLYSVGSISITFAGDTHVGNELIELIKDNLDLGYNIQKAINISLINYIDFSSYARVQMLIAYHEDKPELYSIDNKKSPYLNEVSDFMAFGSPPSGLREYSLVFYEAFKKSRETEKYATAADEIFLLRMLALLQSYGIHNYTIEKGIGGAYSGLYVTKNKAHWQPDMCYLILKARNDSNENLISSIYFRDNIKFIITDKINAAFSTFLDKKRDDSEIECLYEEIIDLFDAGKFKYIIIINMDRHVATIVDMNYEIYHHYLSLDIQEDRKGSIGFIISDPLQNKINDDNSIIDVKKEPCSAVINYISYIPMDSKDIIALNEILPEIRLSK